MTQAETIAEHGIEIANLKSNTDELWKKYDRVVWLLIAILVTTSGTLIKVTFFNG